MGYPTSQQREQMSRTRPGPPPKGPAGASSANKPVAYFAEDSRSWRCDGCGTYGSVSRASNGHRVAAQHVAMHNEECTPPTTLALDLAADLTVIRPGDTILVRVPSDTPAEHVRRIADQLRERLPNVADVLVLAGADGIAVYRPNDE